MGQSIRYVYDSYGKTVATIDALNRETRFVYDTYDRLVREEFADGSTRAYSFTDSGRLLSITDPSGTISFESDELGRLTRQINPDGSYIAYGYNAVGQITSIATEDQTVTKTYDKLNRLKSVTDNTGTTTYDYSTHRTEIRYPNGIHTVYTSDSKSRIERIEHFDRNGSIMQSFAYTHDLVGNRTQVVEKSGRTVDYTYDSLNRLTGETISNDPQDNNTVTTFSYDLVGNLISKTVDGVSTEMTYNANDQLIVQDDTIFAYDDLGNLITRTQNSQLTDYGYDVRNRLMQITTPSDVIGYDYDAKNQRSAKRINGVQTDYLVDANTHYARVLKETTGSNAIHYTYGNSLISQQIGTQPHFYHSDALGSTRLLSNGGGARSDSFEYNPYGTLKSHTGSTQTSYLFTGERLDRETDNYYLRARYYDPGMHRFTQKDTYMGSGMHPITMNHYLYANANPQMYVDPSGNISMLSLTVKTVLIAQLAMSVYETAQSALAYDNYDPIDLGIQFLIRMSFGKAGRLYRLFGNKNKKNYAKGCKKAKKKMENYVKVLPNSKIKWYKNLYQTPGPTNNYKKNGVINTIVGAFSGIKTAVGVNRGLISIVNSNNSSSISSAIAAIEEHTLKQGLKFMEFMPELESWKVGNCAEFHATYKLIFNGGVLDLPSIKYTHARKVLQTSSGFGKLGIFKPACNICREAGFVPDPVCFLN